MDDASGFTGLRLRDRRRFGGQDEEFVYGTVKFQ